MPTAVLSEQMNFPAITVPKLGFRDFVGVACENLSVPISLASTTGISRVAGVQLFFPEL